MPSVSVGMAGIAVLSDGESTSSGDSLETVVETPQNKTDSNTTDPATEPRIEETDKTEQDAATAEVLADIFADDSDSEDLTTAEKLQLQQEQQEQQSQELFPPTDPGTDTVCFPLFFLFGLPCILFPPHHSISDL